MNDVPSDVRLLSYDNLTELFWNKTLCSRSFHSVFWRCLICVGSENVFIFVHRGGRAMAVWLILSRQLKQRPLKMIACFCPSWCDFSTLQSGSRNGTNPTPHFKWIWVPYVRFHGTYAHVFTIAGLCSLYEDLDRPITSFVCLKISWRCVWRLVNLYFGLLQTWKAEPWIASGFQQIGPQFMHPWFSVSGFTRLVNNWILTPCERLSTAKACHKPNHIFKTVLTCRTIIIGYKSISVFATHIHLFEEDWREKKKMKANENQKPNVATDGLFLT